MHLPLFVVLNRFTALSQTIAPWANTYFTAAQTSAPWAETSPPKPITRWAKSLHFTFSNNCTLR